MRPAQSSGNGMGFFTDAPGQPGALGKQPSQEYDMNITTKLGSKIKVGDLMYVGLNERIGKIIEFKAHPGWPGLPGHTSRVAVTDRGSITIGDQHVCRVPA